MQINTGQQLLEHTVNGGSLKLNEDNTIETQSKFKAFFQDIRDLFASCTESGRTALEQRTSRLHQAVTNMLQGDGLIVNLANDPPDEQMEPALHPKLIMCAVQELSKCVKRFPNPIRSELGKFFFAIAQNANKITNNPETTRANIRTLVKYYATTAEYAQFITSKTKSVTNKQLQENAKIIKNDVLETYALPVQQAKIINGIHASYLKDAPRDAISSINEQPVNANNMVELMHTLIPNDDLRGLVTFLVSQGGLVGSITDKLYTTGLGTGYIPQKEKLIDDKTVSECFYHKHALTSDNNNVYIDTTVSCKLMIAEYAEILMDPRVPLAKAHITLRTTVPKDQVFNVLAGVAPQISTSSFVLNVQ